MPVDTIIKNPIFGNNISLYDLLQTSITKILQYIRVHVNGFLSIVKGKQFFINEILDVDILAQKFTHCF
jgi:hypothetical protein